MYIFRKINCALCLIMWIVLRVYYVAPDSFVDKILYLQLRNYDFSSSVPTQIWVQTAWLWQTARCCRCTRTHSWKAEIEKKGIKKVFFLKKLTFLRMSISSLEWLWSCWNILQNFKIYRTGRFVSDRYLPCWQVDEWRTLQIYSIITEWQKLWCVAVWINKKNSSDDLDLPFE